MLFDLLRCDAMSGVDWKHLLFTSYAVTPVSGVDWKQGPSATGTLFWFLALSRRRQEQSQCVLATWSFSSYQAREN